MSDPQLRTLREKLCRELAQSERSARVHGAREAKRLGDVPPGAALLAISEHAAALDERVRSVLDRDQPVGRQLGRRVGELFSNARHLVFDRLIDTERSYRGTLLGVRHGIDTARLLREVAARGSDRDLVALCDELIATRSELIANAERALAWFASEPARAIARPA